MIILQKQPGHAPGPWAAVAAQIYCETTGETLAVLPGVRCDEPISANAHLIAAAPELLEACKAAAANIREGYPLDAGVILEQLESAIARAGGKL